ncbi:Zinc finger protein, partial [Pseudolycoriella hygida]
MEGVWIKTEPGDAEYPVILDVKSEVGADIEESAPSVILEPENLDIKSEITLGEYEFSSGNTLTESKKERPESLEHQKKYKQNIYLSAISMEGVWIKMEPLDAGYPVILDVKSEVGAGVEESAPSVTLEPDNLDIKSEITLGEYEFSTGNTLTESKKEVKRKKNFKCEECGGFYLSRSHLVIHQRIHTGERPFQCDICESKFFTKRCVAKHMFRHTGEVRQRPIHCPVCDKNFRDKQGLKSHMIQHTNRSRYSCEFCDMKFYHITTLKIHLRTHTGEKPFVCDDCGKGNLSTKILIDSPIEFVFIASSVSSCILILSHGICVGSGFTLTSSQSEASALMYKFFDPSMFGDCDSLLWSLLFPTSDFTEKRDKGSTSIGSVFIQISSIECSGSKKNSFDSSNSSHRRRFSQQVVYSKHGKEAKAPHQPVQFLSKFLPWNVFDLKKSFYYLLKLLFMLETKLGVK